MVSVVERLAGGIPGLWESALSPTVLAQIDSVAEPRWSPDGQWLSFLRTHNGEGRIVVVPAAGGPELAVSGDPQAQAGGSYNGGYYTWAPDSQSIAYAARDGKLWIVPIMGGPARRLLESEGRQAAPTWSPDGSTIAYVASTPEWSAIAVAPVDGSAWPRRVSGPADFVLDPAWSPDSRRLAWLEWDVPNMPWDASRIVVADLRTGERSIVAGAENESTSQPRFSPDGKFLAFLSDRLGWLNLWLADGDGQRARPLLNETFEHGPPSWGPGARTYVWSPDSHEIAFLRNDDGNWRLYRIDVASGAIHAVADDDGIRAAVSWSSRDQLAYIQSSPQSPPQVKVVDLETGKDRVVAYTGIGALVRMDLAPAEAFTWTARDGTALYGHLYRPRQAADRPFPLLVLLHGGPTSQAGVGWNSQIQYFVQRGWVVFVPEYRGSTGYGRAYAQALHENWGVYDVTDTVDGIDALHESGLIDPKRVAAMGGSAGGYTTLMLLALAGDRFAAGVDLYGVADLWELNEVTHRFEAHYNHSLIGPLPESFRRYDERSPVKLADRIKAPLLVLQGDADPVVPKSQSDTLVEAIRRHGGTVEYHVYAGEGHGWSRTETTKDALEHIDRFLVNWVLLRS